MKGVFKSFHRLVKVYSDMSKTELDKIDLTIAQAKILLILSHNNNLIQREIAKKAYVEPTTMSRVIDGMVEKGLVIRTLNEHSRRSCSIEITEIGKDKVKQAKNCFIQVEKKMFENFNEEEKQTLDNLINKLSIEDEGELNV